MKTLTAIFQVTAIMITVYIGLSVLTVGAPQIPQPDIASRAVKHVTATVVGVIAHVLR